MTQSFRLFVSSTFSDFEAERNALQQCVFPRLEELCLAHGARFQAIDLRWGVSEEAGQDQRTMRICVGEIERCQRATRRPNFMVLLGDRYGWQPLPNEVPADEWDQLIAVTKNQADQTLLSSWYRRDDNALAPIYVIQPRQGGYMDHKSWLRVEQRLLRVLRNAARAAAFEGERALKYYASATEQEIYHGALKHPSLAPDAFCFVRTIRGLTDDGRAARYVDLEEVGVIDAYANGRLNALKAQLKQALGSNFHEYEAQWNGTNISLDHVDLLCEDVYACLSRVILEEIQYTTAIDPVAREREIHVGFGAERARLFTGRVQALQALSDYLRSDSRNPFAVMAASGAGKSALLAKAFEDSRSQSPDAVVITRFIGATAESANARSLIEGICREICRAFSEDEGAIPANYQDLIGAFRAQLELATVDKPIIIFLDALDQLSDIDHARNLAWLPSELPAHVRLVVSALPTLDNVLTGRTPKQNLLTLEPMSRKEGSLLLDGWLNQAGRTLQPAQHDAVLCGFAYNGLPLYLPQARL